ncbi:uncharacterized protein A4U43_C04F4550 [Asparagus officinalis]|uniref:Alginate lyase 2 domain-containing protein n=1 Tax=Asparagus officinalis TaxID=4686 RepID=A0A5P1F023_ASPOF|nr:citrate-binding protein-like [Asparagus officinalis]ONK71083.1 uncharacterized protein A4U43_C04F4550 [Asparagus officinalis]
MALSTRFLLAFIVSLSTMKGLCSGDPTDGFTAVPLTEKNFKEQWPYNLPLDDRYSFVDGVRKLWVYSTDKPHFPGSGTKPRTEIHIEGYDYSSGVWQFEGNAYVPSGTTGVSIMQIFGASGRATTFMMWVHNGSINYYSHQMIQDNIYDRWFKVNVIHDTGAKKVHVYIDNVLKLSVDDAGGDSHYFKFGVYEQNGNSNCMESRWKGIRVLKK